MKHLTVEKDSGNALHAEEFDFRGEGRAVHRDGRNPIRGGGENVECLHHFWAVLAGLGEIRCELEIHIQCEHLLEQRLVHLGGVSGDMQ